MSTTRQEKHAEAMRELRLRQAVYPRQVVEGRMSQAEADSRIAVMAAIARDYAPHGDLFDGGGRAA